MITYFSFTLWFEKLLEEATLTNSYGYNYYSEDERKNVNVMVTVQLELLSLTVEEEEEEEEGRTLVDSVRSTLAEEYWFAVGR